MTPTPQTPVDALMALVDSHCAYSLANPKYAAESRRLVEASARALAAMPAEPVQKMAPVQGWPQGIPWSLHLEAYAAYSKKWAPQPALIDLEGRNCRGGFGTEELDEFIPGWRERASEITALREEVAKLRADISGMVQADADAALAHMQQAGGVPAGWQPIETAPKDRTEILACWPKRKLDDDECPTGEITGYAQCVTAWQGFWIEPDYLEAHGSFYFEDEAFAADPTHWMPLPATPAKPEQNNG